MKIKHITPFLVLFVVWGCQLGSDSGCSVDEFIGLNEEPIIDSIFSTRDAILPQDTTSIFVEAHDSEDEELSYTWRSDDGTLSNSTGQQVLWRAPNAGGNYEVHVDVEDLSGAKTSGSITITVVAQESPVVNILSPRDGDVMPGLGSVDFKVDASHPNGIREVLFFVNDSLVGADNSEPYSRTWNIEGKSGEHRLRVEAFRVDGSNNRPGRDEVIVNLEGATRLDRN